MWYGCKVQSSLKGQRSHDVSGQPVALAQPAASSQAQPLVFAEPCSKRSATAASPAKAEHRYPRLPDEPSSSHRQPVASEPVIPPVAPVGRGDREEEVAARSAAYQPPPEVMSASFVIYKKRAYPCHDVDVNQSRVTCTLIQTSSKARTDDLYIT